MHLVTFARRWFIAKLVPVLPAAGDSGTVDGSAIRRARQATDTIIHAAIVKDDTQSNNPTHTESL
jgi:hypothetical protein